MELYCLVSHEGVELVVPTPPGNDFQEKCTSGGEAQDYVLSFIGFLEPYGGESETLGLFVQSFLWINEYPYPLSPTKRNQLEWAKWGRKDFIFQNEVMSGKDMEDLELVETISCIMCF